MRSRSSDNSSGLGDQARSRVSIQGRSDAVRTGRRAAERASDLYDGRAVIRSRSGSFDASRNREAVRDREAIGRVRMRTTERSVDRTAVRVDGRSGASSGRTAVRRGNLEPYDAGRFDYATRDLIENNYSFVTINHYGDNFIHREYLIDYGGRWGHAPAYYNGHNYHFYLSLVNFNFFGINISIWNRRYYGDGWDLHFGWSPYSYILSGWRSHGVHYFEPCYAFSFTFNHGYERGYIEGFRQGTQDWNYSMPYRSFLGTYSGYYSYWGPLDQYRDGYEQGFRQGYYAGYAGQPFGYQNYGFGDFGQYPVVYDYDYNYYSREGVDPYDDDYYDESGYDYSDYGEESW